MISDEVPGTCVQSKNPRLTRNRSLALARLSGSTLRAQYRKSLNTSDMFCSSLICGVPLVAMSHSARRGDSVRYGGSPSIISMAMMPSDQMSTFCPYSFRVTTSGAIQYGVPTIVVRLFCASLMVAQKPKSAVENVTVLAPIEGEVKKNFSSLFGEVQGRVATSWSSLQEIN